MNDVARVGTSAGDIMESVIVKGDLSKLTPEERSRYYGEVCRSVGLNPLTKPFEFIVLNGKLQLYALRNCTDQLRQIHHVSVVDMSETERDGIVIVTCKVANSAGRTDMAKGAVALNGLKGEALCNAVMKAETKAKRRATLSICGLGWLDETEIEAIQTARPAPAAVVQPALAKPVEQSTDELVAQMLRSIAAMTDVAKYDAWKERHKPAFARLSEEQWAIVQAAAKSKRAELAAPVADGPEPIDEPAPDLPHDDDGVVPSSFEEFLASLNAAYTRARSEAELEEIRKQRVDPYKHKLIPPDQDTVDALFERHMTRLGL